MNTGVQLSVSEFGKIIFQAAKNMFKLTEAEGLQALECDITCSSLYKRVCALQLSCMYRSLA